MAYLFRRATSCLRASFSRCRASACCSCCRKSVSCRLQSPSCGHSFQLTHSALCVPQATNGQVAASRAEQSAYQGHVMQGPCGAEKAGRTMHAGQCCAAGAAGTPASEGWRAAAAGAPGTGAPSLPRPLLPRQRPCPARPGASPVSEKVLHQRLPPDSTKHSVTCHLL